MVPEVAGCPTHATDLPLGRLRSCTLQLQNSAQTHINGALQTQRKGADVLRQKIPIERDELGGIRDRVAWQARRARR